MVADWIISAGAIAMKCIAGGCTLAVCVALYLVETQQTTEGIE